MRTGSSTDRFVLGSGIRGGRLGKEEQAEKCRFLLSRGVFWLGVDACNCLRLFNIA